MLQQVLRLGINVELARLVLREIEGRHLRNVLVFPFALFFLQFEGDSADRTTLNPLHQVGGIPGNLRSFRVSLSRLKMTFERWTSKLPRDFSSKAIPVGRPAPGGRFRTSTTDALCFADLVAETLGSDDRDFIAYSLVGLKVESEFGIITLDYHLGGLLDRLRTDSTHFGGVG